MKNGQWTERPSQFAIFRSLFMSDWAQAAMTRGTQMNAETTDCADSYPHLSVSISVHPWLFSCYGTQLERMTTSCSGFAGSLVRTWTRKSWGPSMPSCIINSRVTAVSSPGWSVVEPTTARGGQQPSTTFTSGFP